MTADKPEAKALQRPSAGNRIQIVVDGALCERILGAHEGPLGLLSAHVYKAKVGAERDLSYLRP